MRSSQVYNKKMNIYNLLLLFSSIFTIIIGVVVFARNNKQVINQVFSLLTFMVAISSLISYFINVADSPEQVYALLNLVSLRLFIFPLSVHFYLLLTGQKHLLKGYVVYILLYLFPSIMIFTTDPEGLFYVRNLGHGLGWAFTMKETIRGTMLGIFIMALTLLLLYLGIRHVMKASDKIHKSQSRLVLAGFVLSLVFPVVFDLVFPMLPVNIPPTSSGTFIIGYSLIAWAIIKFELFSATPESAAEDILTRISDAVLITDKFGRITFANQASLKLFNCNREVLRMKEVNELFETRLLNDFFEPIGETKENQVKCGYRDSISVMVTHTSLHQAKGQVNGHAFVFREITELRNLIDRLAVSETRYKNIFENIQSVYVESSMDGIILEISPSISLYTSYKREELLGLSTDILYSDPNTRISLMEKIKRGELHVTFETQLKDKDGRSDHCVISVQVLVQDGIPYKVVGTVTNVDALKKAEKHLAESEERYRLLYETSPNGILLVKDLYNTISANQAALNVMGAISLEDFLKRPLLTQIHPDDRQAMIERARLRKEGQPPVNVAEIRILWDDGQTRYLEYMAHEMQIGDEGFIQVILHDVTEVRKAEMQIRRNEEKYRLFLENFQGIAFRMRLDGNLEFLYGDVFGITGYTIEDFFHGIPSVAQKIHPEDRVQIFKAIRMLRKIPNSKIVNECRIIHRNGSIHYLRLYLQNLMDENGQPSYIQAAMFDKTDYYDMQHKVINSILETEDRERMRFAEDLHDELGPLLSSVRIYINLIQTKSPEQEKERLELIEFAKQLLDDAVQQTKNISYNLMPEVLSQYGLIPSIKAFCTKINIANSVNISLQTEQIDEEKRYDNKVELALYRVVKELIHNTLKHAHAKNIIIRFSEAGNMPVLEYADDGIGFNVDEKIQTSATLGVRNIFHRIESVNGIVNYNSVPGKGIKVVIKWQEIHR